MTSRFHKGRPAFALVALLLVVTAWWCWQIPAHAMPFILPDGWVSLWALAHCRDFLSGSDLYHTTFIMGEGTDLFLHNVTEGIFLPIAWVGRGLSIESLYWAACLVILLLNSCTAFLSCYGISRRVSIGLFCGLIAGFHPYVIAHLEAGHLNLMPLFPLFLLTWTGVGWHRGNRYTGDILSLSLLIVWGLYIDHYLFALMLLFGGGWGGYLLFSRQWTILRHVAISYAAACIIGGYKLVGIISATVSQQFSGNHDPSLNGIDLLSLFVPGMFQASSKLFSAPSLLGHPGYNWAESGGYLGIGLGIVLIVGIGRWRQDPLAARFAAATFGVVWLALGPVIRCGWVELGIPSVLQLAPPFFPVPARFMGLGLALCLATCSFVAEKHPKLVLSCLIVCLLEIWPTPLPSTIYSRDDGVAYIASRTNKDVVLDVGVSQQQSMYRQVYHRHKLFGGFLARTPRRYLYVLARNPFLRWVIQGEPQTRSIAEGFERLKVGLLYVNTSQVEVVSRLKEVQFLTVGYQGPDSIVFIKRS